MRANRDKASRSMRVLALLVAVGCIGLQLGQQVLLALVATAVWLVTLAIVDAQALRRLKMPKFWAITIALALGSGLLLGPRDIHLWGVPLSATGLEAGALMVLRGVFIFALTSYATRALSFAPAHRIASRVGLGNLSVAVASAFGVLPAIRDGLAERHAEAKKREGSPLLGLRTVALDAVYEAARLAELLARQRSQRRASMVVIVGARGAGKTTATRHLAQELEERGLKVGGLVQPPLEGEQARVGYDLEDIRSGERIPLARRGAERFDFDDSAWSWAEERLKEAQRTCDVVVIDEVGRLEARGQGHIPAIQSLDQVPGRARVLVASVREECLPNVETYLGAAQARFDAPMDKQAAKAAATGIRELFDDLSSSPDKES